MDWIASIGDSWLTTLAWLGGLGVVFGVAARLMPCNPGMYWWRDLRAVGTDFMYWFVVPVFIGICRTLLLTVGLKLLFGGAQPHFFLVQDLPLWLQCVVILLIQDVLLYWIHRLFHTRLAWKIHAIHHSPTVLDWLSAARFHPINFLVSFCLADVAVLLMGFSPKALVLLVPFNIIYSSMVHANLNWTFGPLRYLFASPVFHRWHHTTEERALNKNFAPTFPLLDVIFGTFYMPAGELPTDFGEHDFPTDFWGQLVHPFRTGDMPIGRSWGMLTGIVTVVVVVGVMGFGVVHGRHTKKRDLHEGQAVDYFNDCDYDRAVSAATEALAQDPNHASSYANRGASLLQQGKIDQAIADCTRAIEIDPNLALAFANRGGAYLQQGALDKAIADCTRAIEIDPRLPIAHANRGGAYLNRGEPIPAIADCTRAIQLDPRLALAYLNRGGAYFNQNNLDQAIIECTEALKCDPNLALAYFTRGGAYFGKGDLDSAIKDWNETLRLNPTMVHAYANRATAHLNKGEIRESVADYTEAIQREPKLVVAYLNRGTAQARLGDIKSALRDLTQAINLDPNLALAYAYRGALWMEIGDAEQVIADCTRAIELDPRLAVAYWSRGLAFARGGYQTKAKADQKKAVELDPTLGQQ